MSINVITANGNNDFAGDTGSGRKGLVPAPSTGDALKYLKGDGTWASLSFAANAFTTIAVKWSK